MPKTSLNRWLNAKVIATVLIVKFLILIYAAHSYQILDNKPISNWQSFGSLWSRWDAESYLKIAASGYAAAGDDRFLIVFFPLYPLLVAIVAKVVGSYILSAFLISGLASIALGLLFRQLVKLDYSERTAQEAVLFLFIFPTAYFLHIPYTESLFIALVVGCFLAARTGNWITAGIVGGLACLTRVNGVILFPAILFEIREQYNREKNFNRRWLSILLIPAGFAAYLLLNYVVTGDTFRFLQYQNEHWGRYLRLPFDGLWSKYQTVLNETPVNSNMVGLQELLFVAIGLTATIAGWKYLRASYRFWMLANWTLFVSTSFVLSVPRYTLTMFPLFILIALAARRDWWFRVLVTVWSIAYLGLFTSLFVKGFWAF